MSVMNNPIHHHPTTKNNGVPSLSQAADSRTSNFEKMWTTVPIEFADAAYPGDGLRTNILHFPPHDRSGKEDATATTIAASTERKRAEWALRKSGERARLLINLSVGLASTPNFVELLRAIAFGLPPLIRPDASVLSLSTSDTRNLRDCAVHFPEGKGFLKAGAIRSIQGSMAGYAFREAKPFLLSGLPD